QRRSSYFNIPRGNSVHRRLVATRRAGSASERPFKFPDRVWRWLRVHRKITARLIYYRQRGTCASTLCLRKSSSGAEEATSKDRNQGESTMITRQLVVAACAVMVLNVGSAYAGPCTTGG